MYPVKRPANLAGIQPPSQLPLSATHLSILLHQLCCLCLKRRQGLALQAHHRGLVLTELLLLWLVSGASVSRQHMGRLSATKWPLPCNVQLR